MGIKMKYILLSMALLSATAAASDDVSMIVGFGSHHFKSDHYNENNPAIGVKINQFDLVFVTKNSVGSPSFQMAWNHELIKFNSTNTAIGLRLGIATGYHKGAQWNNGCCRYEYTGSPAEIGSSGVLPFFAINVQQKLFDHVYADVSINQDLLMFGGEYKF